MIGSLIGAGLGVAGSIFGGIKASQAMKARKTQLENEQKKNASWYDREYNIDETQRDSAQRILRTTQDNIRKRNRAAAGTAAVMGGTEESVAAQRESNNEALADAASRIAAAGESRKERVQQQYRERDASLNEQLGNMDVQKAQNIGQAVQGAASAAAGLGNAIDDWRDERNHNA